MWRFTKKWKYAVGERVYLVDGGTWSNQRQLIGRNAIIRGLPSPTNEHRMRKTRVNNPEDYYLVDVEGFGPFGVVEAQIRRFKDGEDPLGEPRGISDDTPNKLTTWDKVAWQPKETVQ